MHMCAWMQERNELALERFGVTWDDLPPQNRVLVAAHMCAQGILLSIICN